MDLSIHNPYITSGILIPDLVSTGPVGGHFLHEGPHEIVHDDEFQVGLIELVNMLNNLLYHQLLTDFGLGWTKVASLHLVLLREHIEGAIEGAKKTAK